MTAFIIDASIALAWCFEDEVSEASDAILDSVRASGASVPALWHLEVANVLLQAEKLHRISPADLVQQLTLIGFLRITTDHEAVGRVWTDILALARSERLTVYDATYLELAMRLGAPLASLDKSLTRAAKHVGVVALP